MPLKSKKSWREKLADNKNLPKVIRVEGAAAKRWGGTTVAVAAPREIDALMRTVPFGRVTTTNELRSAVARKHGAAVGCPITAGIFAWIAAQASAEAAAAGDPAPTPYWRTLKAGGELNPKFPGGVAAIQRKLAAEGHGFVKKGAHVFVRDLERVTFAPPA